MMINCVIIDDEPLAREGLAGYVGEVDFLNLVATGENPLELMSLLDQHRVDLIFLDIQMPKLSGIDFLKITPNLPSVILTTAYPSYALEGYQLNVLDYLLKPITFERFVQSATKANDYHRLLQQAKAVRSPAAEEQADYFFIKCEFKYEKLYYADILFVEGMQNYVTIFTSKGKYITLLTLKALEQHLTSPRFLRVHKSYLVCSNMIEAIDGSELIIQSHRIPISRNHRDEVLARVLSNKVWKK